MKLLHNDDEMIQSDQLNLLRCGGEEMSQERFCLGTECPDAARNEQRGKVPGKTISYQQVVENSPISQDICYPLNRLHHSCKWISVARLSNYLHS